VPVIGLWPHPQDLGWCLPSSIGRLVSLVEGSFIGSASIGMSLVAYVLLGNIHTIRQLDGISQSLLIFLLIGIYLALHRLNLVAHRGVYQWAVLSDFCGRLGTALETVLQWFRPSLDSGLGVFCETYTCKRESKATGATLGACPRL
jgi:rod shape-determining protein MreD